MPQLDSFIRDARAKGLNDDDTRSALLAEGWDTAVINAALAGLTVPKADDTQSKTATTPQKHTSLSPLMAALHHILLWFFTGSSTVTIAGVVSSLFGMNVSSTALASMIAVTSVTFVPYAILFLIYVRKSYKIPGLVPGKVWSIITICLHSIGAMIASITLVINLITSGQDTVIVSASLILLMNVIVVILYLFAAFYSANPKVRSIVLIAYIPLLFILFGVLFSMSALKLGPAQHDDELRETLSSSVRSIANYTRSNDKLPGAASDADVDSAVTYQTISNDNYKVCAVFQTTNKSNSYYSNYQTYDKTDAYVSESDFYNTDSGNQCFTFKSDYLSNKDLR